VDDGADDPAQITRGGGFGLFGNIVVGVIGALIGGWLFGLLGIAVGGLIGSIIAAVVGAIILLAVVLDPASARVTNTTLILQRLYHVGHSWDTLTGTSLSEGRLRPEAALLLLTVTASSGREYTKLNKLRGAGYVVKCDHPSVTDRGMAPGGARDQRSRLTELARHRASALQFMVQHRQSVFSAAARRTVSTERLRKEGPRQCAKNALYYQEITGHRGGVRQSARSGCRIR
jgi:uncharacterized membrane protein YeaQ/YmgE (transglycosylase-associated protein family)